MKNKFLAKSVKLSALLAALGVTGCAEYHRMILEDTAVCGPEFTRTLAKEYEDLGNIEHTIMYDDWSANYYYCKAIYARQGFLVNPVSLCKWEIEEDKLEELATARDRLMHVLELGAWQIAPKITAYAQANFDCWVEQQAEGWQIEDIANCRTGFYHYIAEVEHVLKGGVEGETEGKGKKVGERESKDVPERVDKAKRAGKESALERR
jgi:OmpA-OmpF porin, OOP family